jgi:tetratricopeptide (TPR) repeat protein
VTHPPNVLLDPAGGYDPGVPTSLLAGVLLALIQESGRPEIPVAPAPASSAASAAAPTDPLLQARPVPALVTTPAAEAALAEADALRAGGAREGLLRSLDVYENAALLAGAAQAPHVFARARLGKGLALLLQGDVREAEVPLEQALASAREQADRPLQCEVLDAQADAALLDHRPADAVARLREQASVRASLGDDAAVAATALRAADTALDFGVPEVAADAAHEALLAARRAGEDALELEALHLSARILHAHGDLRAAADAVREALLLAAEPGDRANESRLLTLLGRLLRALGEHDRARSAATEALDAAQDAADRTGQAEAHELFCALALDAGQPKEASAEALRALTAWRDAGDRAGEGRAHHSLAACLARLDRMEAALAAIREAKPLVLEAGADADRVAVLVDEARILSALRDDVAAASAWSVARQALRGLRRPRLPGEGLEPPPSLPELLREELPVLVRAGLWARALEATLDAASCAPAPTDIEALRDLARSQDATILAWHALDRSVLAFALPPAGRLTGLEVQGGGAAELAAIVPRAVAEAQRPSVPAGADVPGGVDGDGEPTPALDRLRDVLLAPLAAALAAPEARRLIVLATPRVDGVPFTRLEDDDGTPLGLGRVVAELPPCAVGHAGAAAAGGRLVVDEPGQLEPSAAFVAAADALGGDADRRRNRQARQVRRGITDASGTEVILLPGPAATEQQVRLHLAAVAQVAFLGPCAEDPRAAGNPGLVLADAAPDEASDATPEADGFLSAAEVERLPLAGRTVLLLGCEGPAAERIGSAALRGGARAALVLRWPVPDDLRPALATAVVSRVVRGSDPGRALQEALHGLRGKEPPACWAALRLLGLPR